jgi:hypothetical protein
LGEDQEPGRAGSDKADRGVRMESKEEWIRAAQAVQLLKPVNKSEYMAQQTICKRAHGGMIRARGEKFMVGDRAKNNFDIPAEFWWAEGGHALEQDWSAGDFSTFIDRGQVYLRAFGVSFLRADVEKMIPPDLGDPSASATDASIEDEIQRGYAFIAMPMDDDDDPHLVDVLAAMKSAAKECGVTAERIDDDQKNERITSRMLTNIRKSEFVIVDLTKERPSVYYEAGYAERCGKDPIFVARKGTKVHFDVKDFPIIFFNNLKELQERLTARFRALKQPKTE